MNGAGSADDEAGQRTWQTPLLRNYDWKDPDSRETAALIAIAELGGRLIAAVPSEACGSFPSFSWNARSPVLVDAITRREAMRPSPSSTQRCSRLPRPW